MNKNYDICAGAKRLENVKFSPIRQVLDKAAEMRNNGIDVISLSVGEPDFNTPEMIKKKTIESIQNIVQKEISENANSVDFEESESKSEPVVDYETPECFK